MTDPWIKRVVIGASTLYLGDNLKILPALGHVGAIVTDPPYGIGADASRAKVKGKSGWAYYGESNWDVERPDREIFDLMLKQSDLQIIWGGNYFTDYLPPTMRWLIWDKGQRDFSLADGEVAWTNQMKAMRIKTYSRGKALSRRDGNFHPTQKPVEIMEWCITFIPEENVVVDPFMGSGSTGVACVNMGRRFIGIDIDPKYFDITCSRLEEARKEPDMFITEAKPVQEGLL